MEDLCYDEWTGRTFRSSIAKIESVVNELNLIILENGEVTLNEYYDLIGLAPVPIGDNFGWSNGERISPKFGSLIWEDQPAIMVWFRRDPKSDQSIQRSCTDG